MAPSSGRWWWTVTAGLLAGCPPAYQAPCQEEARRAVAALPAREPGVAPPLLDALPGGAVRIRWWRAAEPDAGSPDPTAEVAVFLADGSAGMDASVPWPASSELAAVVAMAQPPLWVEDGVAEVETLDLGFQDPDGTQHQRSSLRYAHVVSGARRVDYIDVPGTECVDCRLDFVSRRVGTRVLALYSHVPFVDRPPFDPTPVQAVVLALDGRLQQSTELPDAGSLFQSAVSLFHHPEESLAVLGPADAPAAYDERLIAIGGGPFPLEGAWQSVVEVRGDGTSAAWIQGQFLMGGAFDPSGAPARSADRLSSGREVLAVAAGPELTSVVFVDGQSVYAAFTTPAGRKVGGDVLVELPAPPLQAVLRPSGPRSFSLWAPSSGALHRISLRCEP